jgi:uncharacterized membrane-anchored protein
MDNQNFSQREKFPEPRGWAMKWVFEEMEAQLAEQQVQESCIGAREKFAEPRSWAMKWDGFALSKADERQNGDE